MKSSNLLKFGLVFGTLLTSACGGGSSSSNSFEELKEVKINSLKEGLEYIYNNKNYKFDIALNGTRSFQTYFTRDYVGTDSSGAFALDLYINDGTGIYSLNYTNEEYASSEYRLDESGNKYTDLYDNTLVKTMYHVGEDFVYTIEEGTESTFITNKKYKLALIQTLGISSTAYVSLNDIKVSYVEGKIVYKMNFSDTYIYTITVSDFGTTFNKHYQEFIKKGGKVMEVSKELAEFRRLLKLDNFSRYVYDFDVGGFSCIENFHPHYFYTSFLTSNSIYGYMSMDQRPNENHPDNDLCGCYYFTVNDGIPNFNSMPFSNEPDIPTFFHYPRFLSLLDNLHLMTKGLKSSKVNYSTGTSRYLITNSFAIENFAKNFSLTESYDLEKCPPSEIAVELDLDYENPKDSIITFHYVFTYQGSTYDYMIPITNFGGVGIKGLDDIYEMYND